MKKKKKKTSPKITMRRAASARESESASLKMRASRKPSLRVNTTGEKITFEIPQGNTTDRDNSNNDPFGPAGAARRGIVAGSPSRYSGLSPRRAQRPLVVNFDDAGSYNRELLEQRVKQEVDKRWVWGWRGVDAFLHHVRTHSQIRFSAETDLQNSNVAIKRILRDKGGEWSSAGRSASKTGTTASVTSLETAPSQRTSARLALAESSNLSSSMSRERRFSDARRQVCLIALL